MPHNLAFYGVDDIFGNVGCEVGNVFKVTRDGQQVNQLFDLFGIAAAGQIDSKASFPAQWRGGHLDAYFTSQALAELTQLVTKRRDTRALSNDRLNQVL